MVDMPSLSALQIFQVCDMLPAFSQRGNIGLTHWHRKAPGKCSPQTGAGRDVGGGAGGLATRRRWMGAVQAYQARTGVRQARFVSKSRKTENDASG